MNSNVEIINDHLFGVNMGYVSAGFIQDLKLIKKDPGNITLTNQGTLVIDKGSKLYPAMKQIIPELMTKSDAELQSVLDCIQHPEALDALDDLIVNLCGWELKRRLVRSDYLKEHPETLWDKIKRFFRKKVIKWLRFRQEYN